MYRSQEKYAESCYSWDRDSVNLDLNQEIDLQVKVLPQVKEKNPAIKFA